MSETLPLLTFIFGVFTGGITVGLFGLFYVKKKLAKMKQMPEKALAQGMNQMMSNMGDMFEPVDEEDDEDVK